MKNYRKEKLLNLITLAQNDDEKALEEIVRRYENIVYENFCSLNPYEDLSDLTQEALLRMTKSIKSLKNPKTFEIWLKRIIRNLFFDSLRKKNKMLNYNLVSDPIKSNNEETFGECIIDESKLPDENTLNCELKMKINYAISTLPPLFKTIILLREVDGLSYEEISKLTNMNIGTVKSRLARARLKLKKELEVYINGG